MIVCIWHRTQYVSQQHAQITALLNQHGHLQETTKVDKEKFLGEKKILF